MMKKTLSLAVVFFAGMYGDTAWEFIRQLASRFQMSGGFMINLDRLGGVVGAAGVTGAIFGAIGLIVTAFIWSLARQGDKDAQGALRPVAAFTSFFLATCVLGAATYVMIPDAKKTGGRTVANQDQQAPVARESATVKVGSSIISLEPDGSIRLAKAGD